MRKFLLALPFALLAGQASAACTQEDLQKKMMDLMPLSQQLQTKNPQASQDLAQKIMKMGQELQAKGAAVDMDAACKFYDDVIVEVKKAL